MKPTAVMHRTPVLIRYGTILFTLFFCTEALTPFSWAEPSRIPLKGSASFETEAQPPRSNLKKAALSRETKMVYQPGQTQLQIADRLTRHYKLDAAETLYRKLLLTNPHHAGALNGLGKVTFFSTTSSNQNHREATHDSYETAVQYFLSALRYQPGYVEARLNLASVYMEQGRLSEAEEEVRRALKLAPPRADVLAKQGECLIRSGREQEAIPFLKRAILLDSANVQAHYYLGEAYAASQDWDATLKQLHMTLSLQPNNAPAHYLMGVVYEAQGNGTAAIAHYQQSLGMKPEFEKARLAIAEHHQTRGDSAAALEDMKQALDASMTKPWTLVEQVGQLSIANGQAETAVKYYRQWLEAHPEKRETPALHQAKWAMSIAKTAVAKQKLRDNDLIGRGEASRYLDQAISLQPDNFEARLVKAKLDQASGEALKTSLKGQEAGMIDVSLQETSVRPYQSFEKGKILLARFQFQAAEQAFRSARQASENQRSTMVFGELFLSMGMPMLAEEVFQQVLKQLPDNSSALMGLASVQEARVQSQAWVMEAKRNILQKALPVAVFQLEKAIRADIKNPEAHYLLAQVYEKTGDYSSAADHYYGFLQLDPYSTRTEGVRKKLESLKLKMAKASSSNQ